MASCLPAEHARTGAHGQVIGAGRAGQGRAPLQPTLPRFQKMKITIGPMGARAAVMWGTGKCHTAAAAVAIQQQQQRSSSNSIGRGEGGGLMCGLVVYTAAALGWGGAASGCWHWCCCHGVGGQNCRVRVQGERVVQNCRAVGRGCQQGRERRAPLGSAARHLQPACRLPGGACVCAAHATAAGASAAAAAAAGG